MFGRSAFRSDFKYSAYLEWLGMISECLSRYPTRNVYLQATLPSILPPNGTELQRLWRSETAGFPGPVVSLIVRAPLARLAHLTVDLAPASCARRTSLTVEQAGNFFVLDEDDHPNADLVVAAEEGCAMDPSRLAFHIPTRCPPVFFAGGVGEPRYFRRNSRAILESFQNTIAKVLRPTYAIEEFRLQHPRYTEGGRGECYAQRGVGTDEEVLCLVSKSR